jgi:hypothetical protein
MLGPSRDGSNRNPQKNTRRITLELALIPEGNHGNKTKDDARKEVEGHVGEKNHKILVVKT